MSPRSVRFQSLPREINDATREQHTYLNRLIIERLPLALPPHANSLEGYGRGLAVFAQIYLGFETAARELSLLKDDFVARKRAGIELQRLWILDLFVPGLQRLPRLAKDITYVSKATGANVLESFSIEHRDIAERIRQSILAKPHLLVAYCWVMYMAVFSGGRWIRQQLLSTGSEFWLRQRLDIENIGKAELPAQGLPGFTFLYFEGDHDGEDIKAEFKARLAGVEADFTQEERQEIIEAAQGLFDDCVALVGMLDGIVGGQVVKKGRAHSIPMFFIALACLLACVALKSCR